MPKNFGEYNKLSIVNYNARDFGYEYAHASAASSKGVAATKESGFFKEAVKLQSYIHLGGSCGFPGGCNNQSPREPGLDFQVTSMQRDISINLLNLANFIRIRFKPPLMIRS